MVHLLQVGPVTHELGLLSRLGLGWAVAEPALGSATVVLVTFPPPLVLACPQANARGKRACKGIASSQEASDEGKPDHCTST